MAANRLAGETSPYLLQHAENPVDWYPWGAEAIEKARAEDRPIFLSIGYSACHWCHVMAHESFEDSATAAFLRDHFVSVKVDREERPDIDALYMRAVMLMTGSGGWPLTVFLTPGLRPFFGGTYFPGEGRWGMPSFRQVLEGVAAAYRDRRREIDESATGLLAAVKESFQAPEGEGLPGPEAAERALSGILERFDAREGGFGGGPKFPQPPLLGFMLDEAARRSDGGLRDKVLFTLRKMEAGGVRDQVGGGFHRYAVDGRWLVPHYEKMLYDNAQLASLYFRAFSLTREREFLLVAREVLADVERSMSAAGGGFVAALDADSEGEEGRFYLWTPRQLDEVLGPEGGRRVATAFGISEGQGLEHQTLHRGDPWDQLARSAGLSTEEYRRRVSDDLARLARAREARPHPGVDTKVLTDWNALMATAYIDGALACGEPAYLQRGRETLALIWRRCWDGAELHHVWDGRRARVPGFLSDYAGLASAEWRAYEATGDPSHLKNTGRLVDRALALFREPSGRFVDAPPGPGPERPIIAVRDTDDGVLPAPLSLLARVLWAWERLTDWPAAREALDGLLRAEAGSLERAPASQPLLAGLAAARARPPVDVVVAAGTMEEARPLLDAARALGHPDVLALPLVGNWSGEHDAEGFALFKGRSTAGEAVAYVCVGGSCRIPVSDAGSLTECLAEALGMRRRGEG